MRNIPFSPMIFLIAYLCFKSVREQTKFRMTLQPSFQELGGRIQGKTMTVSSKEPISFCNKKTPNPLEADDNTESEFLSKEFKRRKNFHHS